MKIQAFVIAGLLFPASLFAQSIKQPMISSSEDPSTNITEINTTAQNTVVTFKYTSPAKGAWVQLNKSMYLQDANGEERYEYLRSEGIPLRPEKLVTNADNQEVTFKVYFKKLKPDTKEINVIERARSIHEMNDGINFLNFYRVSLQNSRPAGNSTDANRVDVMVMPPPSVQSLDYSPVIKGDMEASMGPMMSKMYTSMLTSQLAIYDNPEITAQLARITKSYYDALIKVGFPADAALKIIIAKPLVSTEGIK